MTGGGQLFTATLVEYDPQTLCSVVICPLCKYKQVIYGIRPGCKDRTGSRANLGERTACHECKGKFLMPSLQTERELREGS